LVVLAHAQGTSGFPEWIPSALTDHGKLASKIFFVISGFLITTLLMEERSKTGVISLGLFYARRTLRIFPPLYGFLTIIAIATWLGALKVPAANFLAAVTFTMNYVP
jgi:peptidoglycan/LPS O-acetylase OafA/YrhL